MLTLADRHGVRGRADRGVPAEALSKAARLRPVFLQQIGPGGRLISRDPDFPSADGMRGRLVATIMIRLDAGPSGRPAEQPVDFTAATPIGTRLSEAGGSRFVGLSLGDRPPLIPAGLHGAFAQAGLACMFAWHAASLLRRDVAGELAALRPCLDWLRATGGNVLVFAETSGSVHADIGRPLSTRPVLDRDGWGPFGVHLTRLAEVLAAQGAILAYHPHLGTIVQSREDIAALMDNTGPSVRLLLDTGHTTLAGADPAEIARAYAPRIAHVHATDVGAGENCRARLESRSFSRLVLDGVFTAPGEGEVDFPAILSALPDYRGWVVIETGQADPLDHARLGYRTLRRIIARGPMQADKAA